MILQPYVCYDMSNTYSSTTGIMKFMSSYGKLSRHLSTTNEPLGSYTSNLICGLMSLISSYCRT